MRQDCRFRAHRYDTSSHRGTGAAACENRPTDRGVARPEAAVAFLGREVVLVRRDRGSVSEPARLAARQWLNTRATRKRLDPTNVREPRPITLRSPAVSQFMASSTPPITGLTSTSATLPLMLATTATTSRSLILGVGRASARPIGGTPAGAMSLGNSDPNKRILRAWNVCQILSFTT